MKIQLLYGCGQIEAEAPSSVRTQVLTTHLSSFKSEYDSAYLAQQALEYPIGVERLYEWVWGAKRVVILPGDHTRPVPSRILIPLLLREIRTENPEADIAIPAATGCHRVPARGGLPERYGETIVTREKIEIRNHDDESLADTGEFPSGNRFWLNRTMAQTDVLVGEGFIEPHFFAKFSGGRKSVLPGVYGRTTVMHNHYARNIGLPESTVGVLETNQIYLDMVSTAGKAGLGFIPNVIISEKKEIIAAIAGHPGETHEKGCDFLENLCGCRAEEVNIVAASNGGCPLNWNIYQSVKGMTTASWLCKTGGIIVTAVECTDGYGGEQFRDTSVKGKDAGSILRGVLARDEHGTQPDQWQFQIFARVLVKNRVTFVSSQPEELMEEFGMRWALGLPAAMELAVEMSGMEAPSILVLSDAASAVAIPAEEE